MTNNIYFLISFVPSLLSQPEFYSNIYCWTYAEYVQHQSLNITKMLLIC